MTSGFQALRRHIYPRAAIAARGPDRPARVSDIVFGMTLVMLLLVLIALALTHLFAAG